MNSYYASAERTSDEELNTEIEIISTNRLMSELLNSVNGLMAVLDENRQIITINNSFLEMLGIRDPGKVLGLRPGEALNCTHAHEEPGGCGTSKSCSTCGAAISIVVSIVQNKPVERICALTVERGNKSIDIALKVKSNPIKINGKKFLLLFMQDISLQQQRAAFERTFFHDMNNILNGVVSTSQLLLDENNQSDLINMIYSSSLRLKKEIDIQRTLLQNESCTYHPVWEIISIKDLLSALKSFFNNHPAASRKNIIYQESFPLLSFRTDFSLLTRVLCNMITNALEATDENGNVKIWLENKNEEFTFYVWSKKEIPEDISARIFQRNFSTKNGEGRGIGTYSMKLFGEQILGGCIDFTTSKDEGTVFRFSIPIN